MLRKAYNPLGGVGRHCETSLCELVAIHKIHKVGPSLCGLLKTEDRQRTFYFALLCFGKSPYSVFCIYCTLEFNLMENSSSREFSLEF